MALDSQRSPALLCEIKVNAISEVEKAKEKSHGRVRWTREGLTHLCKQEQGSGEHKRPAKQPNTPRHEKAGGVKRATVESYPDGRQESRSAARPNNTSGHGAETKSGR